MKNPIGKAILYVSMSMVVALMGSIQMGAVAMATDNAMLPEQSTNTTTQISTTMTQTEAPAATQSPTVAPAAEVSPVLPAESSNVQTTAEPEHKVAEVMVQTAKQDNPVKPKDAVAILEFNPTCTDKAAARSYWNITNKSEQIVALTWQNNGQSDVVMLPAAQNGASSVTKVDVFYNSNDANNQIKFSWDGATPVFSNSNMAVCSTPPADDNGDGDGTGGNTPPVACADITDQNTYLDIHNIAVEPTENGAVRVTLNTKDGLAFCEKNVGEQVNFSMYYMPDTYNGEEFYGNPTAFPQTLARTVSTTIHAGDKSVTLELSLEPQDFCHNMQFDLYYGPVIQTVGANGHGAQNIWSEIVPMMEEFCVAPVTPPAPVEPGKGGVPVHTLGNETPAPQPVVAAGQGEVLPSELPQTGAKGEPVSPLYVLIAGALTYLTFYGAVNLRKQA